MKGSSKVIMGTTMAMLIILAIVLGLVLVLLAELYCSLLLRRRKLRAAKPASLPGNASSSGIQQGNGQLVPSPLSSFYAQGVLDAPRSFLFPKLPSKREKQVLVEEAVKLKHGKLHEFLRVHSPPQLGLGLGLGLTSSSPSPTLMPAIKPRQSDQHHEIEVEKGSCAADDDDIEACHSGQKDNFMYISNPIYDNEVARTSRVDTPFETPDSSPSRMNRSGSDSSGDEENEEKPKPVDTSPKSVPLTPMKDLPTKACSIPLRDARSLGTSISDSTTQIGRSSYSSSETPSTSPSW